MPVILLPGFPGFYESSLSQAIDYEESSHIEYECDTYDKEREARFPEEIRLNESEMASIFFDHTQYSIAYQNLARDYLDSFADELRDTLGIPVTLQWESMSSPREYNFATDRVFATISESDIWRLWVMSSRDGHETLRAIVRQRFTSRSGFLSYYDNDLDSWIDGRRPSDFDHNELSAVLEAAIEVATLQPGFNEYAYTGQVGEALEEMRRVVEDCLFDGAAGSAWQSAVDWPAVEKAQWEARGDKLADLRDEEPETYAQVCQALDPTDLAAIVAAVPAAGIEFDSTFRADDRADAKDTVREIFPAARFHR